MDGIVYVNGEYVGADEAAVSPFDRGFLFADAVYEVTSVVDGKLIDFDGHVARLRRSLDVLKMAMPLTRDAILDIHRELVIRNALQEGLIYMQVTRGVAERDFALPPADTKQTLFLMVQNKNLVDNPVAERGLKIATISDKRWDMCDVKTVQLLYASLAKAEAKAQGADDAWLVRDGMIGEGTSNNAYIVTHDGKIITRDLGPEILPGITRKAVLALADRLGYEVIERAFSVEEAEEAAEAFLTSAGTFVLPVVAINQRVLSNGAPGEVSTALRKEYLKFARETAI